MFSQLFVRIGAKGDIHVAKTGPPFRTGLTQTGANMGPVWHQTLANTFREIQGEDKHETSQKTPAAGRENYYLSWVPNLRQQMASSLNNGRARRAHRPHKRSVVKPQVARRVRLGTEIGLKF